MDEKMRAEFESWITSPPLEKPVHRNPESSGFPGQYRAYEVQLAWESWQASRAALVDALELALEYWRDRQQRYKNRKPRWVADAESALSSYRKQGDRP